jgi:uncharacterized protein (TIGR04255 family)
MPGYLPFAGKNAIAEMSVGIQLASPLDQRVGPAVDSIKAEFAADLPRYEPLQMITINIANVGPAQVGAPQIPVANAAPSVTGFNFTKTRPDGSMARALRAMGNLISMHFSEYVSWAETKPQAMHYIFRCLDRLPILDRNQVTGILLRYIDRFIFDGPIEEASANRLLQPGSRFVAPQVLDSGYQWHCNSGWFQNLVGEVTALNQLNISSGPLGVIVDHNSACILPSPSKSVAELVQGRGDNPPLESVLDRQHDTNRFILTSLLNREMLATIGLET